MRKYNDNDWACFHDTVLDATGNDLPLVEIKKLYKKLPFNIKFTALQWGMNDTVFGDEAYCYLQGKKPFSSPLENVPVQEKIVGNVVRFHKRASLLSVVVGKKGLGKHRSNDEIEVINKSEPTTEKRFIYKRDKVSLARKLHYLSMAMDELTLPNAEKYRTDIIGIAIQFSHNPKLKREDFNEIIEMPISDIIRKEIGYSYYENKKNPNFKFQESKTK